MRYLPELRIDPEFQRKIPPLTEAEFKQLEENILEAGQVYEPIVTWDGVIVDGHNRWKIIQTHPEIRYSIREMDFADKWAAFDWMYKNQLGRRNLTDEQRAYMIGKMYEARKNSHGASDGFRGNQHTEVLSAQNEHLAKRVTRQDEAIGKELGVSHMSVRRNEKFAKGIDALREVSPEAADKVLEGKAKATKSDVAEITKLEPKKVEAAAKAILSDVPFKTETSQTVESYGIEGLIEVVEANGRNYVAMLTRSIETRRFVITGEDAKERLKDALTAIISDIEKVRESL